MTLKGFFTHCAVGIVCFFGGIFAFKWFLPEPEPRHAEISRPLIKQPIVAQQAEIKKDFNNFNDSVIYEYHLQLGTFRVDYFAQQLAAKLTKRGYQVQVKPLKINGEKFNLVEVGPFAKYFQATKHRSEIVSEHDSLGKVMIKKRIKP